MKLGIYGGTFSPPHNGHVRAAKLFLENAQLDKLLIMPAGIPPHKTVKNPVDAQIRMEMCKAAFYGVSDKIEVSDFEVKKGGRSYTIETVEHYLNEGDIYIFCGEDMICSLDTWVRAEELMKLCSFYTLARDLYGKNEVLNAAKRLKKEYGARITVLNEEPLTVSSTEIRKAVFEKKDVSGLVPQKVCEIIEKYKLYR